MDDAQDCLISFTDFLFAFQAQFYYDGKFQSLLCLIFCSNRIHMRNLDIVGYSMKL